jgi:hypothetical protein
MLIAAALALYFVGKAVVPQQQSFWDYISTSDMAYVIKSGSTQAWWKQLLGGMSIAVAMTG